MGFATMMKFTDKLREAEPDPNGTRAKLPAMAGPRLAADRLSDR